MAEKVMIIEISEISFLKIGHRPLLMNCVRSLIINAIYFSQYDLGILTQAIKHFPGKLDSRVRQIVFLGLFGKDGQGHL